MKFEYKMTEKPAVSLIEKVFLLVVIRYSLLASCFLALHGYDFPLLNKCILRSGRE